MILKTALYLFVFCCFQIKTPIFSLSTLSFVEKMNKDFLKNTNEIQGKRNITEWVGNICREVSELSKENTPKKRCYAKSLDSSEVVDLNPVVSNEEGTKYHLVKKSKEEKKEQKEGYICENCGSQYLSFIFFKRHKDGWGGCNHYKCRHCDTKFINKELFDQHKVNCRLNKPISENKNKKCDDCGKMFSSNQTLRIHMNAFNKEAHYACDQCERAFSNKGLLKKHQITDHYIGSDGVSYFLCGVCYKKYGNKRAAQQHQYMHPADHCSCYWCGKTFYSNGNLRYHELGSHKLESHKLDIQRKEKVLLDNQTNNETFMERDILLNSMNNKKVKHMTFDKRVSHTPISLVTKEEFTKHHLIKNSEEEKKEEELGSICENCGRKYLSHIVFNLHKNGFGGCNHYRCSYCSTKFINKEEFDDHKVNCRLNKPISENKNKKCDYCGKMFSNKANLKTHMDTFNNKVHYPCDQCDKVFKNNKDLEKHHFANHYIGSDGVSYFICDVCYKKCASNTALYKHRNLYSKEHYRCDLCEKIFRNNEDFKKHDMSQHKSQQPQAHYACDQGVKIFDSNDELCSHELASHSQKKVFLENQNNNEEFMEREILRTNSSNDELSSHELASHSQKNIFLENQNNNEEFMERETLRTNSENVFLENQNNKEVYVVKCGYCGWDFPSFIVGDGIQDQQKKEEFCASCNTTFDSIILDNDCFLNEGECNINRDIDVYQEMLNMSS